MFPLLKRIAVVVHLQLFYHHLGSLHVNSKMNHIDQYFFGNLLKALKAIKMSEHSHKQAIPNDLLLLAAPELLSFAEIVHKILQIVRVELLQRFPDNFN